MGKVIVYLEAKENELKKVSRELVSAAKLLGDEFIGVISTQAAEAVLAASGLGLSRLVNLAPQEGKLYASETFAAEMRKLAEAEKPAFILFGQTPLGRDLAARLAAGMKLGFINDVTAVEDKDGGKLFTKPLYAGKVIGQFRFLAEPPCVVSIRPNIFTPSEGAAGVSVSAEEAVPDFSMAKSVITGLEKKETGMIDLKEADVIISGGRGMGGPEQFEVLFDFARAVGAAVGASRSAVDSGWIDHAFQVGQTGKTVNPSLYIACGISGAIQHLAGMQTSKCIVAINTNEGAPIFRIADFGIVADLHEAVPLLKQAILRIRGEGG